MIVLSLLLVEADHMFLVTTQQLQESVLHSLNHWLEDLWRWLPGARPHGLDVLSELAPGAGVQDLEASVVAEELLPVFHDGREESSGLRAARAQPGASGQRSVKLQEYRISVSVDIIELILVDSS